MGTNTTNLGLYKPAREDNTYVVTDVNNNMDKIDLFAGKVNTSISGLANGIAIVSVGNTHSAITSGQYVYVKDHGTLAEGLYTANSNIAANATLTSSNLTAVSGGGLNSVYNSLNSKTTTKILSLSDIFSSLANNITGQATVIGNVITIYMQGAGITDTPSGSDIGTLKTKYKPNLSSGNYVIVPILSNTSPYTPVSSAWIYQEDGAMKKYGSNGFYISVTYIFAG